MKYSTFFVVLLFLWACNPSEKVSEETNDQLTMVYLSSRGDGFDLYKKVVGDTFDVKITNNPGWDWNPQPTSGGGIVLNSTDTSGGFSIRKVDLEGTELSFDTQGISDLAIAPNGNDIVYQRKNGDYSNLFYSVLSAIQDSIQITNENSYNGRAKWSLQSDKIAYISDRTGTNEIFIYDLQTQSTSQLTSNNLREKYISWGPDGKSIVATMQSDSTENDIYKIDIETSEATQLTSTPDINESEIAWSPDGNYIAYHAKVNATDDIFLLHLVSKEILQVTHGEGYHGEPVFVLN